MKNTTLLFLFSFFLFYKTNAQSDVFAPVGAKWWFKQDVIYTDDGGFQPGNFVWQFESVGDTVVEGLTLRKIIKKPLVEDATGFQRTYFILNDSGKLYIYKMEDHTQHAFFDLNAVAGDTVATTTMYPGYFDPSHEYIFNVVDSVRTVLINGLPLKAFYLSVVGEPYYFFTRVFYERFGSSHYFFTQYQFEDPTEGGELRCYEDDSIGLYSPLGVADCEYIPSDPTVITFLVYPNPSSGKIYLQLYNGELTNVEVVDVIGRKVPLAFSEMGYRLYTADLSRLPAGIYFMNIMANNHMVGSQKIVKQY